MSNCAILSYAQLMLEVFLYLDMYVHRIYIVLRTSMNSSTYVGGIFVSGHVHI